MPTDDYTEAEQEDDRREWNLYQAIRTMSLYLDDAIYFAREDTDLYRKMCDLRDEISHRSWHS